MHPVRPAQFCVLARLSSLGALTLLLAASPGLASAAETTPAHTTFGCDGETFALLICGRIGLDAAIGDKRVIPTGDMAGVQAFKKWFGWV
jgi:hypothetical protein